MLNFFKREKVKRRKPTDSERVAIVESTKEELEKSCRILLKRIKLVTAMVTDKTQRVALDEFVKAEVEETFKLLPLPILSRLETLLSTLEDDRPNGDLHKQAETDIKDVPGRG